MRAERLEAKARRLLEKLEGVKENPETVDDEVLREAERILSSPNPIEEIEKLLDSIICGERENKLTIFVLLLSGKIKNPRKKQLILLKGEAGGGKSTLMKVADFFKTKDVGRLTSHALDYMDNLGKYEILRLKELGRLDDESFGVSTLKFLSSDDKGYTVEYTVGSAQTGFKTKQKRIPPITVISSTTRLDLDPQLERRAWILCPDESIEQTERIKKWKAEKEREEALIKLGVLKETSEEKAKRILRKVVELIEPQPVIIPFPETLMDVLDKRRLRTRGDFDKVLVFVELYGLLNQRRLEKIKIGGREALIMTPEIALEALKLIERPLIYMSLNLEGRLENLIMALKEYWEEENPVGDAITQEDKIKLAQRLGKTAHTIHLYLNSLEALGFLKSEGGRPKTWVMVQSPESMLKELSVLSSKIKIEDDLIPKMRKEAIEFLNSLSSKIDLRTDTSLCSRVGFENNELSQNKADKEENDENKLQSQNLKITEAYQILEALKREGEMGELLIREYMENHGIPWDEALEILQHLENEGFIERTKAGWRYVGEKA